MSRNRSIPVLAAGMLAVAAGLLAAGSQPGGGTAPPEPAPAAVSEAVPAAPPESAPAGAAGLTVYKDPETGRLMPVPPQELRELLSEEIRNAMSMSHEGLVETAAPGGGVMIDLQGRFQNVMWAQIGPDGKLSTNCDQGEPTLSSTSAPQDPKE
jgi:hypothetical protein